MAEQVAAMECNVVTDYAGCSFRLNFIICTWPSILDFENCPLVCDYFESDPTHECHRVVY